MTGSKYTQAVEKVGQIISNSPTEIKVRALNCFASLIGLDKDPDAEKRGPVDHRVTLMTREWFRSLSTQPSSIEILFEICKNPFPDIRLAGFTLLDAVCQHQWGEELVARTAGNKPITEMISRITEIYYVMHGFCGAQLTIFYLVIVSIKLKVVLNICQISFCSAVQKPNFFIVN